MAQKKITDLQLISSVTDDLNIPVDDGSQTYRATALQIKNYILQAGSVGTTQLADDSVTLEKLADAIAERLVPVATVLPFVGDTAPAGYLLCEGASVSRTTYAALYAVVGNRHGSGDGSTTFKLPDYRGLFLRGRANGSTDDPDRASRTVMSSGGATGDAVGTLQSDAFKTHTHTIEIGYGGSNSSTRASGAGSSVYQADDASNSTGGNETRPKNAYVNYIIKY